MEEIQNQNEFMEAVPPEIENQISDVQTESQQNRNWKALNEHKRELERELKAQRDMNEKLIAFASQQIPKAQIQQERDELDELPDDEHLTKGQNKKLIQKEKKAIVQDVVLEVQKMLEKEKQAKYKENLQKKYSDFDDIVNPETLSILEEQEPELAQTLGDMQDPYKMGNAAYKYIKALGIADKVPGIRRVKEVEKKIENNEKTIQSPQAFDKRPMAQAFQLSDADKKNLYKEMMGFASRAGFSY